MISGTPIEGDPLKKIIASGMIALDDAATPTYPFDVNGHGEVYPLQL